MRLIDADAFKKQVAAAAIQDGTVEAASKAVAIIQRYQSTENFRGVYGL